MLSSAELLLRQARACVWLSPGDARRGEASDLADLVNGCAMQEILEKNYQAAQGVRGWAFGLGMCLS